MVSSISAPHQPLRALVVDDNSKARKRICKALARKGIEVRACSSLSQGKEFFNAQPIVLARSKDRGPGGTEFTGFVDWVREHSGQSQPYIVAIDDRAEETDDAMRAAAANPGCNAVMATPSDESAMEEPLVAIDQWLDSCGVGVEAPLEGVALSRSQIDSPFQKAPDPDAVPVDGQVVYSNVLVDNAPLAMAMFDAEMRYLVANRKWKEEFKLEGVALTGRSHYEVFPNLPESWRRLLERCLSQGAVERCEEDRFVRPDGTSDWARWEVRPWRRNDGAVGGLIITSEVITDRKVREERLQFEKSFASSLLEHAEAPVMTVDLDGRVQQRNPASEALLPGLSSGEGEPFYWVVVGAPVETAPEKDRFLKSVRVLRESGRLGHAPGFLCRLKSESGEGEEPAARRRSFAWSMIPHVGDGEAIEDFILIGTEIDAGGVKAEVLVSPPPAAQPVAIGSISWEDWKRREKALLDERNLFAAMPESVPIGMLLLNREGEVVYSNPQHVAVLGFDAAESENVEAWLCRGCPDEDYAREVVASWRENLWRKQVSEVLTLATAEGLLKDVRFDAKLLDDGNLLVSFSDVTEARRLEEALHASEAKCRALFQGSRLGMALVDRSGDFFDINAALEGLIGFPRWEMRAKPLSAVISAEDLQKLEAIDPVSEGGDAKLREVEVRLLRKDKEPLWVRMTASPVRDHEGNLFFTAYTVSEMEERSHAKRELEGHRGQKRALLEAIPDLIMMLDGNSRVIDMIPATNEFVALDVDHVIRDGLGSEFAPLAENINDLIHEVHERGRRVVRFEFTTQGETAEPRCLEARIVRCAQDKTLVMVGDVTDRERAQKSLRRQAMAFENVDDAIVLADVRGCITDANPAAERLFGYAKREIAGKRLFALYEPENAGGFNRRLSQAFTEEQRWEERTRFVHKDGSEGVCEARYVPVEDESGEVTALVGIHRPADSNLTGDSCAALAEFQERVGNDLLIVSKLLNLQIGAMPNPVSRRMLRENQSRLLSMSFIYHLLADAKDRGSVDFSKFVEALVEHLRQVSGVSRERVEVVFDWKGALIDASQAVPLALIATELLSNSFEHAFPEGREGTVRVHLNTEEKGAILAIGDDGVGLPMTFDLEDPPTLGLQVVKILVDGLNGRIVLAESPDTEFHVRFRAGGK